MAVSLTTEVQTLSRSLSSFTTSSDNICAEDSKTNDTILNVSSPCAHISCCSGYDSGSNNSTYISSGNNSIQDSDSDSDSDDDPLPAYWWLLPEQQTTMQQQQQFTEWQSFDCWSADESDNSWQELSMSHEFYYGELPKLPKSYRLPPIQRRKLSCLLSKILRHAAFSWGLHISADGFLAVHELLNIPAFWEDGTSLQDIQFVVEWEQREGEKQRFAMRQGPFGPEIRANQGHSQEAVDGQLVSRPAELSELPTSVLHGTYCRHLTSILAEGLKPMRRHHIHMFIEETCVGRHDAEVLVHVNVARAHAAGIEFLLSENGVVLSTGINGRIPAACFSKVIRVEDGALLEEFGDHAAFVVPSTPETNKTSPSTPETNETSPETQVDTSNTAPKKRPSRRLQGKTGWAKRTWQVRTH